MYNTHRSIGGHGLRLATAAGLALLGAGPAQAQWNGSRTQDAQLVFEWQGNVDRETQINVGQRNVSVQGTQSNESRGRFVSRGSLPQGSGTLYVQRLDGRGDVSVIQQPGSGRNGYGDGIIRIRDPQGGAGFYDVRVYFRPDVGTYSSYPNGGYPSSGYPNNGGYGRDDRGVERGRGRGDVARDRYGNVVYDRNGNPVYERRGNRTVVRDRNGNVVFDRNGHAVYARDRDRRGDDDRGWSNR